MESRGTLFREIHKNTWLKRVTADNRKIPVGTKVCICYISIIYVHAQCTRCIPECYVIEAYEECKNENKNNRKMILLQL